MAKTALYNMEGAAIGEIELSDAIFASDVNVAAMHLVVRSRALCPVPTKACWSSATRSSDAARRIEQWLRLLFTIWKARPLARLN